MAKYGYAFILEGATEKVFYKAFLTHLCEIHGTRLVEKENRKDPDLYYTITYKRKTSLIKFGVVNTVSQITKSDDWFRNRCVKKFGENYHWVVVLGYDRDSYNDNISSFYEGDWADLRKLLMTDAEEILDFGVSADIEDILLADLEGVCGFLGCSPESVSLHGTKGKRKMQHLFQANGFHYHEGDEAEDLIRHLDMEKIKAAAIIDLAALERKLFPE